MIGEVQVAGDVAIGNAATVSCQTIAADTRAAIKSATTGNNDALMLQEDAANANETDEDANTGNEDVTT